MEMKTRKNSGKKNSSKLSKEESAARTNRLGRKFSNENLSTSAT